VIAAETFTATSSRERLGELGFGEMGEAYLASVALERCCREIEPFFLCENQPVYEVRR
jgi:hypothetical protein